MTDILHNAMFLPDLLVAALERHPDRPAVYLGDEVLTGKIVNKLCGYEVMVTDSIVNTETTVS